MMPARDLRLRDSGRTPRGRAQPRDYRQRRLIEKLNSALANVRKTNDKLADAISYAEANPDLDFPDIPPEMP